MLRSRVSRTRGGRPAAGLEFSFSCWNFSRRGGARSDDHRVQDPDGQVDGERGRQQRGPRRVAGAEPECGRQRSQQPDGYLRAGTVSPLYGGRMFACKRSEKKKNGSEKAENIASENRRFNVGPPTSLITRNVYRYFARILFLFFFLGGGRKTLRAELTSRSPPELCRNSQTVIERKSTICESTSEICGSPVRSPQRFLYRELGPSELS